MAKETRRRAGASRRGARHSRRRRRKPASRLSKWLRNQKKRMRQWAGSNRIKLAIAGLAAAAIVLVVLSGRLITVEKIPDGGYQHDERFDSYQVINGIDVSYAQGGDIDWKKLKKAGVDFVFVRCGYRASADGRLHPDEFYRDNLKKAHKAGLMVGAYFFSQAITKKEALAEADYLISLVDGYDIDLPLVMDYETYPGGRLEKAINGGLSGGSLAANVDAFARRAEAAGYDAALYANYGFLTYNLPGSELSTRTNIWVAQYSSSCQFAGSYNFWQCSDSLQIEGITGSVDRDFWYVKTGSNIATGPLSSDRRAIGDCRIELKDHNPKYWSGPVEPGVVVSSGGKRLREGVDYTVGYANNQASGMATVIVSGIGEYKDKYAMNFRIR